MRSKFPRIHLLNVTTQPCHCEAVFTEAVSRFFLRKRLFGDYLGPVPMVQDRDLFLPETGLGLALPETGLGLALPETGSVAGAPSIDKSGCFF